MTVKEAAVRSIQQLPEVATWEDIQERINFVAGVRKGLRELDEGQGISSTARFILGLGPRRALDMRQGCMR